MADKTFGILVVIALIVGAFFLFGKGATGIGDTETQSTEGLVVRTVPLDGNGRFEVEYSSDESGKWVAVIVDEIISGDCEFKNGEDIYKTVIIGDGPMNQITEISGKNCIIDGDFDFYSSTKEEKRIGFGQQSVN